MRVSSLLLCAVFLAVPALAGEAPYNPRPVTEEEQAAGCHAALKQVEDSIGSTHAANMSHVQKFLGEARAAQAAGNWVECYNRAQDALHWET